jgi:hypothetical protein
MFISGVVSVIISSQFVNLTSMGGSGGAIFFGASSGFSLYGMCFIIMELLYVFLFG